ncbi:SDR family NAD(P)-dependent oxidoreductase [Streptomyces sp. 3214.6]|uniref:SDR family NAD(P)-dependent oxidoreductase n=1 Tax=Streptomyces sp. 3214.6 TaxID=1882757 RepID=UPI0009A8D13D
MGRLDGRVAIVTGGARGIGAAVARLLAAEGAHVVVADILEAEAAPWSRSSASGGCAGWRRPPRWNWPTTGSASAPLTSAPSGPA